MAPVQGYFTGIDVVAKWRSYLLLGLIESTLKGIYVAARYRYAVQGGAGGFFSEEVIEGAFRPK